MGEQMKRITIDESIQYIGDFKLFQKILAAMFCTMMFPSTYQVLIMVFGALNPPWKCSSNSTVCKSNETFSPTNKLRCSLPIEDWEFTEPKEYSIVTWFDIYCDSYWLVHLSKSISFLGWSAASPFIGYFCDRYGRKKVIFSSTFLLLVSGFASAFAPNVYILILLRFVVGCSIAGTSNQMQVLLSEVVGAKYRPHAGILIWVFFPVSLCVLALKAYLIRTWKTLFIVCSIPYIFVLLFYAFVPESPRWLLLRNKNEELMKTLRRIADMNDKTLPTTLEIKPLTPDSNVNTNPKQLFQTRIIRKIFLIQSFGWFTHGVVHYGLYMAARDIGGSLYLNFFLLSVAQVPAAISAIFITDKFGRKISNISAILSASAACLLLAVLPTRLYLLRVAAGLIGIISTNIGFKVIKVWRIELFPTNIRSIGVGFTTIFTRAGAGSSPWLVAGLVSVHPSAPYVCMCVVGVTCSVLLYLLHETKGTLLPDTLKDLEMEREERELEVERNDHAEQADGLLA